jgi:hypothetical protein
MKTRFDPSAIIYRVGNKSPFTKIPSFNFNAKR